MQPLNYKNSFHLYFLTLFFITLSSSSSSSSSSSIISRFQEYLQINTSHPSPNYYEAANFILSQAKSLSLESQTIEFVKNKPLVLLKWPGKFPNLPSILFNSHTDVVPVETHKWNFHPFSAHIDSDGNIFARGSQGFVMNMQPSEAEVGIDIRVPPTADVEALERRIAEEWAPVSRNMTFEFKEKFPTLDKFGKPAMTVANGSNPWWVLLEEAVRNAGAKLERPDIFNGATDASFFRLQGIPAIGFSPIANTPSLAHNHNEFINQKEYLKGVDIYASIIKAFASYAQPQHHKGDNGSNDEL